MSSANYPRLTNSPRGAERPDKRQRRPRTSSFALALTHGRAASGRIFLYKAGLRAPLETYQCLGLHSRECYRVPRRRNGEHRLFPPREGRHARVRQRERLRHRELQDRGARTSGWTLSSNFRSRSALSEYADPVATGSRRSTRRLSRGRAGSRAACTWTT